MNYFRPTIQRDHILSAVYGLPVGLLLSDSWTLIIGVCLLAVITTVVAGTNLAFWMCPIFSFSVVTLLLLTVQFFGDFQISSGVFRILFFGAWGICALSLRRSRQRLTCKGEPLSIAIIAALAAVLISRISWDPVEGFKTIVQHGEDNGAWLNNIAFGMSKGAAWSPDAGVSGGALLATVTTGAISFIDSSSYVASGIDPTGVILWRFYVWGLLLLLVLAVATFTRLSVNSNKYAQRFMMPLMILLLSVLALNEIRGGYLTALLASVWISAVWVMATTLSETRNGGSLLIYAVLTPLVLVVGEMWFPLFSWTLLVVAGFILVVVRQWLMQRSRLARNGSRFQSRPVVIGFFAGLLLLAILVTASGGMYIGSYFFEWSRIVSLVHTGGGGGISTLGVAILLLAVTIPMRPDSRLQTPLTVVLVGTTVTIACVLALALMTPPNHIGYGPSKLFRILTLTLIPLACAALSKVLSTSSGPKNAATASLAVSALFITSLQLGLPLQDAVVLWRDQPEPYWFRAVVQARTRYPDRIPVCLDTVRGRGRSEGAYVCSRLATGLVGGERSSIGPQLYTFQWGNICTIEPDDAHAMWDEEFFSNIVIIVSDRTRLSSEAECQSRELTFSNVSPFGKDSVYDVWPIGWLSSIRWNLAKVIDLDGQEVVPSFQYLIDDSLDAPNFEDAELLTKYQLLSTKGSE